MRGRGMISGYRLAARLPKFVLVLFHPHTRAVEGDAFQLESHSLCEAVFAGERNLPFRGYHTMPRQSTRSSQCPNHLTGAAGKAGRTRDVAIGRHFAFRNFADSVANDFKHCAVPLVLVINRWGAGPPARGRPPRRPYSEPDRAGPGGRARARAPAPHIWHRTL